MSEKLNNKHSKEHDHVYEGIKPRFEGTPVEVPIMRIEVGIPENERSSWEPGVMNSHGGLVAAHDRERPIVYLLESQDADEFRRQRFVSGSANVPLTGGDQRGWNKGPKSRDLAMLRINAAARRAGVKGRQITQNINGQERNVTTMNPFDDGDYLDMTRVVEVYRGDEEIVNEDVVTQVAKGEFKRNLDDVIGRMNGNNNMLTWVTPEGKIQIAPYSEDRFKRLKDLGYKHGDIDIPHSNGEKFKFYRDEQEFAEIVFADMKRRGEKMTMEERNRRFGKTIVPVAFLDIIQH